MFMPLKNRIFMILSEDLTRPEILAWDTGNLFSPTESIYTIYNSWVLCYHDVLIIYDARDDICHSSLFIEQAWAGICVMSACVCVCALCACVCGKTCSVLACANHVFASATPILNKWNDTVNHR